MYVSLWIIFNLTISYMSFNISVPEELIQDVSDQNVIVSGHSQLVDVSCQHLDVSVGLKVDGHSQLVDISCQYLDVSGELTMTIHLQLADVSCQHLDVSGNATLNGSLNVTGNTTLDGTLILDGDYGINIDSNVFHLKRSTNGVSYTSYDHHEFFVNSTSGIAEGGTSALKISNTGYVGIGHEPYFPLDIQGGRSDSGGNLKYNTGTTGWDDLTSAYYRGGGGSQGNGSDTDNQSIGSGPVSFRCQYAAMALTNWTFSDKRIKKNICDLSDNESLEILRQIKPKKYEYIDQVTNTSSKVYGFIAQEVGDVLSYSCNVYSDYIPNIYQIGHIEDNTIKFDNDISLCYDTSGNVYKELKIIDISGKEHIKNILNVSDNIIEIDNVDNIISDNSNNIFVMGQKVDNFHALKKDAIWTISTAALQEVDRQLQEEKTKVATLQSQYNDLLSRVSELENST